MTTELSREEKRIREALELLPTLGIDSDQRKAVEFRLRFVSYDTIINKIEGYLYHWHIKKSIWNAIQGYFWSPRKCKGGKKPYLCEEDSDKAYNRLKKLNENGKTMYIEEFIELAFKLKKERFNRALLLAQAIMSNVFQQKLTEISIDPPSRSWINEFISTRGMKLGYGRIVDTSRVLSSKRSVVLRFYTDHQELFLSIEPIFMFGMDETAVEFTKTGKLISVNEYTPIDTKEELPHFTMCCSHSFRGAKVPSMVILPSLKSLPKELEDLPKEQGVVFCSNENGWQTKETFFVWALMFCHNLQQMRKLKADEIPDNDALLLLDGHSSRLNPPAIRLFIAFRVHVPIFPSHLTHLIQAFDVVYAHPLKSLGKKEMKSMQRMLSPCLGSDLASRRMVAITAFVNVWIALSSDPSKCQTSGSCTGICPFDPSKVLDNKVFLASEAIANNTVQNKARKTYKGFSLGGKLLTDKQVFEQIVAECSDKKSRIPIYKRGEDYIRYIDQVMQLLASDGTLLTDIPPFERFPNDQLDMQCSLTGTRYFHIKSYASFTKSMSVLKKEQIDLLPNESGIQIITKLHDIEIIDYKALMAPSQYVFMLRRFERFSEEKANYLITKIMRITKSLDSMAYEAPYSIIYDPVSKTFSYLAKYYPYSLYWLIQRNRLNELTEPVIHRIIFKLVSSIRSLHSKKVIHLNVRPDSILIDHFGDVIIRNFSDSIAFEYRDVHPISRTMMYYASPESLSHLTISAKSDIWSLGCVIYEILTGKPLFSPMIFSERGMLAKINTMFDATTENQGKRFEDVLDSNLKDWKREYIGIIRKCLTVKSSERPSAEDLLEESAFQNETRNIMTIIRIGEAWLS